MPTSELRPYGRSGIRNPGSRGLHPGLCDVATAQGLKKLGDEAFVPTTPGVGTPGSMMPPLRGLKKLGGGGNGTHDILRVKQAYVYDFCRPKSS